ncbi:MAG: hypothetical protein LLF86_01580 [Nitrospiraceae bacterium]|nr:hypothetical protein [Nitrospiraceae bacterium]
MRRLILVVLSAIVVSFSINLQASEANVDMGVSIGDEGLRGFYFSVGDYYHVPEREVIIIRDRRIPDEELPVVFFLSKHAHVAPAIIVDMRLRGMSWMDITLHYRLHPDIYYVPLKKKPGPPYGKAYGYYMNRPKKDWHKIRLHDRDVVNLVNLRFISEYHAYSPDNVVVMRSKGHNFAVIDNDVRKEKRFKEKKNKDKDSYKDKSRRDWDNERRNGQGADRDDKWDKKERKDKKDKDKFRD